MKKFNKKLGQNFLTDQNIKNKLIKLIQIKNTDIILEIGSGEGCLSSDISTLSKKSHFVEIEKKYLHKLKNTTDKNKSIIHNDNILNFNLKDIIKKYKKIRIIGNLPYKISAKILIIFINFSKNITDMHFILQKEMVEKITSTQNHKKYGKLSIILQHFFEIKILFDIKPQSFFPIPKVMSSFIRLKPKVENNKIENNKIFENILTNFFCKRRKKIQKNINNNENINKLINLNKRPADLSDKDFIKIYETLNQTTEDYKNI